jgi:hypothetical protein
MYMLILNSYGPSQGSEFQRTEPPVDVIIACNCHEGWFDWVLKLGRITWTISPKWKIMQSDAYSNCCSRHTDWTNIQVWKTGVLCLV